MKHTITCTSCDYTSSRLEPYFELQLPILENSLIGCLSAFGNPERVSDWTCPRRGFVGYNNQSSSIESCPNILIIVFKRFKRVHGRTSKVVLEVHWDDILTLKDSQYRLISTISHHNSILSGHYTANILSNNQWFNCNDRVVSPLPLSRMNVSTDVYMMAFERF